VRAQPVAAPAPQPAPRPTTQREPVLRGSLGIAEAAPEESDEAASGGWVSDLLRRASKEDQPAPRTPQRVDQPRDPLHAVESLNSLSVDIARAIDHEASIDLWDRYRRGERNVFTRRLYTLKGQQTFDEIKRKYESDATFRASVDRYINDFERLLRDIAKNDRDNIMTQTYLTSDTGKVYTMLAHASGKLR
ncbi:MAG: kinesin, partial [Oricola sp.]